MADRYCPSCGTEVDADARFCPTCGITLETDAQPDLPDAPAWPRPEPPPLAADATQPAEAVEVEREQPGRAAQAVEPRTAPPGAPAPAAAHPPPMPAGGARPVQEGVDLPFTWPTMLSGWLIGIGSLFGAIALIPRLGDLVSILLFLALLAVAATIFLADRIPTVPRLRLITLLVTTIGLGIALERSASAVRGLETLLLITMLAAAAGALLIELDRDRPMPPSARPGG